MNEPQKEPASGVQQLIDRLRDKGVEAGKSDADALIEKAQGQARETVARAREQADKMLGEAKAESERVKTGGEDAVKLAMRDAVLDLKEQLTGNFAAQIRRLVTEHVADPDILSRIVIETASKASGDVKDKDLTLLLPDEELTLDDLRERPEEVHEGPLSKYVMATAGETLRKGIDIMPDAETKVGIKIKVKDEGVVIDLTDEAISAFLLKHLLPRFRALFEGVVS